MHKTNKLADVNNYALYYGYGRAEQLSCYDIVVVDPAGQSVRDLKKMRDTGTLVLAYLSVMEIADYAEEFILLQKNDFLHINDNILKNKEYDTYLLDLRSPRWQQLLYQKAAKLRFLGYDGFFLDTIGDIENPVIPAAIRDQLFMAAVNILRKIRNDFSDQILVQNSGIDKVCLYTANLLDGICWENPPFGQNHHKIWMKAMLKRLEKMKHELNLKIFILVEDDAKTDTAKEAKRAQKRGFLFYKAVKGYTAGIR